MGFPLVPVPLPFRNRVVSNEPPQHESWLTPRRFRWLEAALLFLGLCLHFVVLLRNEEVYDERVHINCGVLYWMEGDTISNPHNPPLRNIVGFPAYLMGVPRPAVSDQLIHPDVRLASIKLGRVVILGVFLGFCWAFGRLARRWMGPESGLLALALMLFEPTTSAHATLATTDLLFVVTSFGVVAAAYEWWRAPRWSLAILGGALVALNLLSKYTAIPWLAGVALVLVPLVIGRAIRHKEWGSLKGVMGQGALALLVALIVVGAAYRFEGVGRSVGSIPFAEGGPRSSLLKSIAWLPSPFPAGWIYGLDYTLQASTRTSYFHMKFYDQGDAPLYFPVLLAMKPPLWVFGLLGSSVLLAFKRRVALPALLLFAVPPLFFFAFVTLRPGMQIGIRHALAVFPFILLAGAWAVSAARRRWQRAVALLLAAGVIATGICSTPHQLAYFNELAGGPAGAWRWFNDSNQDWGQGTPYIGRYIDAHRDRRFTFDPPIGTTGWVIVSTNMLTGVSRAQHEQFRWLREGPRRKEFVPPYWHVYRLP